jgi:hypothetical protein
VKLAGNNLHISSSLRPISDLAMPTSHVDPWFWRVVPVLTVWWQAPSEDPKNLSDISFLFNPACQGRTLCDPCQKKVNSQHDLLKISSIFAAKTLVRCSWVPFRFTKGIVTFPSAAGNTLHQWGSPQIFLSTFSTEINMNLCGPFPYSFTSDKNFSGALSATCLFSFSTKRQSKCSNVTTCAFP